MNSSGKQLRVTKSESSTCWCLSANCNVKSRVRCDGRQVDPRCSPGGLIPIRCFHFTVPPRSALVLSTCLRQRLKNSKKVIPLEPGSILVAGPFPKNLSFWQIGYPAKFGGPKIEPIDLRRSGRGAENLVILSQCHMLSSVKILSVIFGVILNKHTKESGTGYRLE